MRRLEGPRFVRTLATALLFILTPLTATVPAADARTPSPAFTRGTLTFEPCHLDDLDEEVFCSSYEVDENRTEKSGRTIALKVAVLPAQGRRVEADPIFLLSGGPGQAATDAAGLAERIFAEARKNHDIVLVDLRGTGGSNPLDCDAPDALLGEEGRLAAECLADLLSPRGDQGGKSQADPRFYTSELAMDDLDDVRRALGYESINIWGGSYGTRMALVYLARHGEHVRSLVLDSIAPFSNKITLYYARDAERAMNVLIDDCAADAACHAAYPRFREVFADLMARLAAEPEEIDLPNPDTGTNERAELDDKLFGAHLRNLLYSRQTQSLIPYLIHQAAAGNFAPFQAAGPEFQAGVLEMMHIGMTFSVVCADDVARVSDDEVADATTDTFLGTTAFDAWRRICANWPHAAASSAYATASHSDVPALLLSGRNDPVTPPSWGDELAAGLPQSLHVVVPGGAHIVSHEGCVPDLIARFIADGGASAIDTSCVEKITRTPFVIGNFGTAP